MSLFPLFISIVSAKRHFFKKTFFCLRLLWTARASALVYGPFTYSEIGVNVEITDCEASVAGSLVIPAMLPTPPWEYRKWNK
ncbi:MAG: hypothetical protein MK120_05915 [Puniceicoccaceae bacterium]|nr:hypothetical protein [Puniceicoccaceae bacterium]